MPTYLVRVRGMELAEANLVFGLLTLVSGLGGTIAGGWLGDRLVPRLPTAYFLVSGVGLALSVPCAAAVILLEGRAWVLAAIFLAEVFIFLNTGPLNAIIANVSRGYRQRAPAKPSADAPGCCDGTKALTAAGPQGRALSHDPPCRNCSSDCSRPEDRRWFANTTTLYRLLGHLRPPSAPPIEQYLRFTQRPWVGTCFFGFEEPVENMPQYGLEYGRVAGIAALLLCTDLKPEQKEALLVNYIQVGIDLGGMVRAGHPGWTGWGGHGSGRKLPIVFAGLLLGDGAWATVNQSFPKVSFGEDEQTAYGACWTGATVVFAGHSGIDAATGAGRSRGNGWGPYEHLPPAAWKEGQNTSESYRRCCTSVPAARAFDRGFGGGAPPGRPSRSPAQRVGNRLRNG